ncbi:MAG TPA: thioredoxin domain-containing protein [Thermoanaerobaculia bacterium]|nr:thioredoxin domain-containing protein [Thermoanaerobaculia bacterium]
MTNRLANEVSPYLLQHAHNPVDWFPWGDEALAKARAEDKPIFLSIGYSACHWCHVMERESFEDEATAQILNEHFVSIKVDREERPDIDSIYMTAVQMMTGHGGWPMSMFLTPDGAPFYAGTYFPPDDRHGMPSFRRVLLHVAEAYRSRKGEVNEAAAEMREAIARQMPADARATIEHHALDSAAMHIAQSYDRVNGGFGSAPKFPPSMTLDFLMQVAWRTDDRTLDDIVVTTLKKMAHGGMYDQIGGGFHRYSVDARWLVPHFEKMLYDNALLARLYTRAWQWKRDPEFARIAHEILGWVTREMTSPDGGFYSTLDADSEGEEGKFYVWSRREVMDALGADDGRVFCELYDVSERGNWEGHNILNLAREPQSDAERDAAERGKCHLYGVRAKRVWPGRDEKILAAWNGWMLAAFAEAAMAFDRDDYRDVCRRNAEFLLGRIHDGRLTRHHNIGGLLEDYAGVAWGLTLAYEATHERRFLDAARGLAEQILDRFADDDAGFFDTPIDHEPLLTRPKDLFDNATPSGNSLACDVLLRLAILFGEARYADAATRALESLFPLAQRYPSGFGFLLGVAEWRAGTPKEIAITGSGETFRALRRVAGETYLPHRVIVAGEESNDLPLMQHREPDRAYVCEAYACLEPTSDPERLRELLR